MEEVKNTVTGDISDILERGKLATEKALGRPVVPHLPEPANIKVHEGAQWIPGNNGGKLYPFTSQTSAAARQARRQRDEDKLAQAFRRGMVKAGKQVPDLPVSTPLSVAEHMAEQWTAHSFDPSVPGAVQAGNQVIKRAFPVPDRTVGSISPPSDGLTLTLGSDLARELLAELRARRSSDGQDER